MDTTLETWEWATLAVIAGLAVLLVLTLVAARRKRRRRTHLQEQFGPEYERTVASAGRREGERRLSEVAGEHEGLDLRDLPPITRERYLEEWRQAEARFVSDPEDAVRAAERLVARVLEERGYPTEHDVQSRAAHIAVDHPDVAERYRHARAMLEGDGTQRTENLRKAMIDFRSVLDEVVDGGRARTAA